LLLAQKVLTCAIHQCVLARRTLLSPLKSAGFHDKNYHLPTSNVEALICLYSTKEDMDSTHEAFLLHTSVHCIESKLSKPRFEMKDETKIFSELRANQSLSCICGKIWLKSLAYWAALFGKLNNLNLKL